MGDCLSDANAKLILTSGACAVVAPDGFWPQTRLHQFFQTCQNQTNTNASGLILPCPVAMNPMLRNCSCSVTGGSAQWNVDKLSLGAHCLSQDELNPQSGNGPYWNTDELALSIFLMHVSTWERIKDLSGGVSVKDETGKTAPLEDVIWPHFYHFYNTPWGKCQIDAFLLENPNVPAAAAAALKTNFQDNIQSLYGLLNGYDWNNSQFNLTVEYNTGTVNVMDANALSFMVAGYRDSMSMQQGGVHSASWNNSTDFTVIPAFKQIYRRLPLRLTDVTGLFGNPFWTDAEWSEAFRRALGKDCKNNPLGAPTTGQDWIDAWAQAYVNMGLTGGGESADNYFDPDMAAGMVNPYTNDPDAKPYLGQLPRAVPFGYLGAEDIHRVTVDPTKHGYVDKCYTKDITEKVLPIVGGVLVGGVTSMIVPGNFAKVGAFGLGYYSGSTVITSVYGENALFWANSTLKNAGEKNVAAAISIGFAPLCVAGMFELGFVPTQLDATASKVAVLVSLGAAGYYVLYPGLEQVLVEGGDFLEMLLSPVSVGTNLIHSIFDGCAGHTVYFGTECKCEESNAKPLMTDALLLDIYGTTGEQYKLRKECMEAAITSPNGSWGTDPYFMGECNSNGFMSTPSACLSAGEWAYSAWPQELNDIASPMRAEIDHCLNANNPSFLPPTDADAPCVKQFNQFARMGGQSLNRPGTKENTCYDFRAPSWNAELGQSTSYDWSKIEQGDEKKDGCVIM